MQRPIVDTHFHLWDLAENYYPWLSDLNRPSLVQDRASLARNYLITDFLHDVDDLNVVAAIHVQAEHDYRDPVRETRWLQNTAHAEGARGFPQGIVAEADFAAPEVERILAQHCAYPNVKGIRYVLHRRLDASPSYDPLENPVWRRNYGLLRKFGLSFDMQLLPQQVASACALIAVNADIPVILTHAAMPLRRDEAGRAEWRHAIRALARFPNVAIKISGFGSHESAWTAESIAPLVAEMVDAFSIRRCMLASNYPVDGVAKSYAEIWRNFATCFAGFSNAEQDAVFWRNALRWYGLHDPVANAEPGAAPAWRA